MPVVEERVASLEGQAQQLPTIFAAIRDEFVKIDNSFARVDSRMDRIEDRMSQQFMWLVGIQLATLVAVVTALISALLVR